VRNKLFLRVIPTLKHHSDIVSEIPSGSVYDIFILRFYLTFCLACTLTFYLTFFLAYTLTFYLTFFLAYTLTFYLASILTYLEGNDILRGKATREWLLLLVEYESILFGAYLKAYVMIYVIYHSSTHLPSNCSWKSTPMT
jgi:hypothetical protein